MFNKNSKFRTYGENDYKGFIMLKNRNTNEVSKHYISSVNKDVLGDVKITVRSGFGDVSIPYKMGSNPKIDIAVKTWVNERYKNNKRQRTELKDWV